MCTPTTLSFPWLIRLSRHLVQKVATKSCSYFKKPFPKIFNLSFSFTVTKKKACSIIPEEMSVVTVCQAVKKKKKKNPECNLNKSNYLHAQGKLRMQRKSEVFNQVVFTLIMTLLRLKHRHDNHCNCLEDAVHNYSNSWETGTPRSSRCAKQPS